MKHRLMVVAIVSALVLAAVAGARNKPPPVAHSATAACANYNAIDDAATGYFIYLNNSLCVDEQYAFYVSNGQFFYNHRAGWVVHGNGQRVAGVWHVSLYLNGTRLASSGDHTNPQTSFQFWTDWVKSPQHGHYCARSWVNTANGWVSRQLACHDY